MRHPVDRVRITQEYGWTPYAISLKRQGKNYYSVFGGMHGGLDYGDKQTIKAINSGKVIEARSYGGWGNRIIIDHMDGVKSLYAHLAQMHVRPGQRVREGQAIGVMGTSGQSTGTHLHLSTYRGNFNWFNPKEYIYSQPKDEHMNCVQKRDDQWVELPSGDCIIINNKNATYIRYNADNSSELERRQFHLSTVPANYVEAGKINQVTKGKSKVERLGEL